MPKLSNFFFFLPSNFVRTSTYSARYLCGLTRSTMVWLLYFTRLAAAAAAAASDLVFMVLGTATRVIGPDDGTPTAA